MAAAAFRVRARSGALRFASRVPLITALVLTLTSPASATLPVNLTGRWTPPHDVGQIAIHLALLRGFDPYGAEVIWWYGLNDEQGPFAGGMLGWKPTEHDCGSWSASDTSFLAPITLPTPPVRVFCGSNSVLADGRLFVAGGTQEGTEFGLKQATVFDPLTREWASVDSMSAHRWYATSTSLATGAQLVSSGSHDHYLHFFAGLANDDTVPLDSALFRYGDGAGGHTYEPLRLAPPDTAWPSPREGHTAVKIGTDFAVHMFGGKDRFGKFLNDYWQARPGGDPFEPDVRWTWWLQHPNGTLPAERWDHSAVSTPQNKYSWMIVLGGIAKDPENPNQDVVASDVWRLWFADPGGPTWTPVATHASAAGDSLGARCGHVALWRKATHSDSTAGVYVGRMLVFGGRDAASGNPSDASLWSLNFSDTLMLEATWEKLSATGPSARFHHALGYDGTAVGYYDTAYVFGGEGADGDTLDDLWRLNVSTLTWSPVNYLGGSAPTARGRASATLEALARRLFVFGGRSDDSTVHVAQLGGLNPDQAQTWTGFSAHNPALSGHVAFFEGVNYARTPEVFTPSGLSGTWSPIDKPHLQTWYPQAFVWKADTVFFSGPDILSYKFAMNTPDWKQFPNSSSGFKGGTAVMYRPGKVMKCGSTDWDVQGATPAVGTTKRIYLDAPDTAQWRPSANLMQPRENHNLVLLPNGKVMVVGGSGLTDGADPKYGPEIWDPDFNSGQGRWSGYDTLAAQVKVRAYHSTALLLPDGRILSGGGTQYPNSDSLEIFCPPYLFNSSGTLATRPVIGSTVERLRYGAQFTICLGASASISSVCLIRPGAVTHGFDQNQRYVPLTFSPVNASTSRLTVTAPPDSFQAPPGDYMLFLVDNQGVPSIARWMRVGSSWPAGDVAAPSRITDLATDLLTCSSISLYWTAVGDDGTTGVASYADIRRSTAPIDSANFDGATPVNPQPVPVCPGTLQFHNVTGLHHSTTYYFAIKFSDESGNASPISQWVSATTLDDCGVGTRAVAAREGGTSAVGERAGEGAPPASLSGATAAAGTSGGTPVVIEAVPGAGALDVTVRPVADASQEGDVQAGASGLLLLTRDGSGRWAGGQHDLPPGNGLALPAPDRATRWVFLEPVTPERVLTEVGPGWIVNEARLSGYGDVTDSLIAGATPAMTVGDTMSIHYAAAANPSAAPSWLIVMSRPSSSTAGTRARSRRQDGTGGLPLAFALHQNLPNPFAAITTIGFALPTPSAVKLEVFDLLGRRVSTLTNALYPAGEHQVVWNRRTPGGALASPGLYFYQLVAGRYRETRRMVILP